MVESFQTLGWVLVFVIVVSVVGAALLVALGALVPKVLNRLSSKVDEEAEMARGNLAVATYFGQVVSSVVLAIALVIAAAIVGGVLLIVL